MYFLNYGLRKTWLDQCLKIPVSEIPSKGNMVNAPKHCSNFKDTSFTISIDHSERNYLTKSLCYKYAKSQDRLLTLWVPMASIPFLVETI